MRTIKTLTFAALCSAVAGPVLADAAMIDIKEKMYDADYQAIVSGYGYTVGVAVYGAYDADYDVILSDPELFQPVLGHYDADYEGVLMPASVFQSAALEDVATTQIAAR
ncbi:MAG: hypothetical protein AAFR73_09045 [Pseudomonadota bacterium]